MHRLPEKQKGGNQTYPYNLERIRIIVIELIAITIRGLNTRRCSVIPISSWPTRINHLVGLDLTPSFASSFIVNRPEFAMKLRASIFRHDFGGGLLRLGSVNVQSIFVTFQLSTVSTLLFRATPLISFFMVIQPPLHAQQVHLVAFAISSKTTTRTQYGSG